MSDEANAASNAVESEALSNEPQGDQQQPEVQTEEIAKSPREAIERAIAKVQEPEGKTESDKKTRNPNHDPSTGKFTTTPKEQTKVEAPKAEQQIVPTNVGAAPAGFTKASQDAWAQTPEPVRADVERRINELTQGLEKYKGGAEAFEPVRKYHDMAQQSGTTLEKALDAYVGIETTWRQNPARGFVEVCRNMGADPGQMLHAIAQGLQGANATVPQRDSQEVVSLKNEIASLRQQMEGFGKTFNETQQQAKQREAQSSVETFAKDHPHFDDVADSIAQMLETGFANGLQDAYDKAVRLNPDVLSKIEAAKRPAVDPAQTREKAAKSITGSPQTGSIPDSRKPAGSAREALQNAFANVGL